MKLLPLVLSVLHLAKCQWQPPSRRLVASLPHSCCCSAAVYLLVRLKLNPTVREASEANGKNRSKDQQPNNSHDIASQSTAIAIRYHRDHSPHASRTDVALKSPTCPGRNLDMPINQLSTALTLDEVKARSSLVIHCTCA